MFLVATLLKALDVWAMGVTLYCFVFGKASVQIFFLCHFITSGSTKGNSEVFISQTAMLVGHSAEQKSNLSGFFVVVFLGCLFEINISLRRSSNSMCPPCVFFFCSPSFFLLHLQCPFIDEYILALHNKIRTRPVEFPET